MTLDEAWKEAEAALPKYRTLAVGKTSPSVASGKYIATTDHGEPKDGYAYGDTPTAALQALTAKLREVPRV